MITYIRRWYEFLVFYYHMLTIDFSRSSRTRTAIGVSL